MANPVWDALAARTTRRPTDPVLAYVRADGARTELSARTLSNNVAKAANALRDEAWLASGDRVRVALPWHWQRAVWTLAAWSVGACVTDGAPAALTLFPTAPTSGADGEFGVAAGPIPPTGPAWAVSLHPLGLPDGSVPAGAEDAAVIVRMQPDLFLPDDVHADGPALDVAAQRLTVAQCLDGAAELVRSNGLGDGGRVAVPESADVTDWLWPTLVPLLADVSVVMVGTGADATSVASAESARVV